jgi:phosphoribosylformylglycinamidine synthase
MNWKGKTIVNLSRDFLNTNGAKKYAKVRITKPQIPQANEKILDASALKKFIASLNICSQKGLSKGFDSSIGAATVITPFGGKYQLTPAQVMAAKIPLINGETKTCSLMSWGFDPEISSASPYHGAVFAVVHSLAKIIAAGGNRKDCWLSFQEYFERLRDEPSRWGKPASALLGALDTQLGLEIAAIGGKDSMSGTFEDIDVPPTLVSFAVSTAKTDKITTPEFKKHESYVYLYKPAFTAFDSIDFTALCDYFDTVEKLITQGKVLSAWAVGSGGTAEAIIKMCMGNRIGFDAEIPLSSGCGFGGFVLETDLPLQIDAVYLGRTTSEYILKTKTYKIPLEELQNAWESTLEPVYPCNIKQEGKTELFNFTGGVSTKPKNNYSKPCFVIPVFPNTNNEYDLVRVIEKAGGQARILVVKNLTSCAIANSFTEFKKALSSAQALVLSGGFSEGDGSGNSITAFLRNPAVTDTVNEFLQKNEGLIFGISSGFQALLNLGLLPYGEIRSRTENSPAFTCNAIGMHRSCLVRTRIISNNSPWLSRLETGGIYTVPFSHSEGRFIAEEDVIRSLAANGQIATQYTDFDGNPSQDIRFNPANSYFAIEGITSPNGRILGRMTHSERFDDDLFRNIPEMRKMDIFTGAVDYFR